MNIFTVESSIRMSAAARTPDRERKVCRKSSLVRSLARSLSQVLSCTKPVSV